MNNKSFRYMCFINEYGNFGWYRALHFRSLASLSHTLLQEGGEFSQGQSEFSDFTRCVLFHWVCSKMFMLIVYFDSIANFDTQYASSGFGGVIKKEILIESPHAVHVFFWT